MTLAVVAGSALLACGTSAPTMEDTAEEVVSGYALAAPPDGYVRCLVNVRSGLEITNEDDAHLFVYADGTRPDPYDGPLYGLASFRAVELDALPLGDTVAVDVGGTPGRLGPLSGFQLADLPAAGGQVVTWTVGERVLQLGGRQVNETDLVTLAAEVTLDGTEARLDLSALPAGFIALGDVYAQEGEARFLFSVDYQAPDGNGRLDDQVTLLGAEGNQAEMEAFRFRAASSRRIEVNGLPGVAADVSPDGTGPYVVTWLADDGLILRLFSFEIGLDELAVLAADAAPVSGGEWTALRDAAPAETCVR